MTYHRVLALGTWLFISLSATAENSRPVVRVGAEQGDLRGQDHRVIQAAIDYLANLGGGTVEIAPGRYLLADAIHLRTGVKIVGAPEKTILVVGSGRKTAVTKDITKGATEITLADATGFAVGDGVFLEDQAGHGFEVTTATLVERLGPKTFRLSQPAASDYLLSRRAEVKRGFSGIDGWKVSNAAVRGVTIEGNWGQPASEYLGGCRGGGIYLHGCDQVIIEKCVVRKVNGDAISFQGKCHDVTIAECLCEDNANAGLHPGSDSHSCVVRNNIIRKNGYVGLFVCVGVKKVVFEGNEIIANGGCGVSIGFADSDNVFRANQIVNNAETGILFRRDSPEEKYGAHRNVFEKNIIRDNLGPRPAKSNSRPASASTASVVIEGSHLDLVFRDNEFSFSKPHSGPAILHDAAVKSLTLDGNRLRNLTLTTKEYAGDLPGSKNGSK
jgi:hypothetical protein